MPVTRTFAVDLGASGGKCFIGEFSSKGFKLNEIHRFTHDTADIYIPDRIGKLIQRTYWDDLFLYQNIIKGLKRYRREVSSNLDSVGIDTWGTDGQFINKDGDMISKVYCYRDHRLDNMIKKISKKIERKRIYEITGIHFQPFNISNQLLWFVENRDYMLNLDLKFLPMPTIFYYFLGGKIGIDSTWASVTQLMDAREKRWSDEVMDALGIPKSIMPEIVEPGTELGRISEPLAEDIKLNNAKLIAVGSHDTASAFAAAPVKDINNALIISSGTWSLIGKLVPEPLTNDKVMEYNLSNEGGIGNIRLLKNCMGTWIIQELLRRWADEDGRMMNWDEVLNLAEKAKPFTAFIDPDYSGFYNPHNMEEEIIAFCKKNGQNPPGDRGTMIRTVYESLAMKYRLVSEELEEVTGNKNEVLHIVGGGSKNEVLNQFAANATGLKVYAGPDEATASGNCMVQAFGLGIIENMGETRELINSAFEIREYEPRDQEDWNRAYGRFKKICKV